MRGDKNAGGPGRGEGGSKRGGGESGMTRETPSSHDRDEVKYEKCWVAGTGSVDEGVPAIHIVYDDQCH